MGKRASILLPRRIPVGERTQLRAFGEDLCQRVLEGRGFVCLVTNDAKLRELNRDFLKHDYATDVLSFPSGEDSDLGQVAISLDRAREQAAEHGHTALDELKVLMLHGALHLAGHDHETDRGQMRRLETKWRKELGLPGGLIERARK